MNEEQQKQKELFYNFLFAMQKFKEFNQGQFDYFNQEESNFIELKKQELDPVVRQAFEEHMENRRNAIALKNQSNIIQQFYENPETEIEAFSRTLNISENDLDTLQFPIDFDEPVKQLKPRK